MQRDGLRPALVGIIPDKMNKRPLDLRGYPVPWFVQFIDGRPDFRVIDSRKYALAMDKRRCWLCGQGLAKYATFVVGPMCIVNRVSAEPPSHPDCARFAVKACPFMLLPQAKRRDANLPANYTETPGMLQHNPGVMACWTCSEWQPVTAYGQDGERGQLIEFGDPSTVTFWREGRRATAAEANAALYSGLPHLQAMADKEGGNAMTELARRVEAALFWFPEVTA